MWCRRVVSTNFADVVQGRLRRRATPLFGLEAPRVGGVRLDLLVLGLEGVVGGAHRGRTRLTVRESALGCLGVLELERLWRPVVCDVGTSRAPVVVRSVVRRRERDVLLSCLFMAARDPGAGLSSVLQDASCRTWSQAQNERRTLRFWRRITYCELINATRPAAAVQVQQRLTSRSAAECSIIAYPQ